MPDIISFVRPGKPPSANRPVGRYEFQALDDYRRLYQEAGGTHSDEHRYGLVYYFVRGYNPHIHADADNISKRIWDALEAIAYADDHLIRLRIAGVITMGPSTKGEAGTEEIDLTRMPKATLEEFFRLQNTGERQILYVELGPLTPKLFGFSLASREDRR